jgi:DNA-directed RNA polymerase subunit beta'
MVGSGARGNVTNLRHLAGGRGRMDTTQPICSNLREGLHPYEFFMSARLSRETLVDKKLRVAYFGDYTRKMVHAAFDLQISEEDCQTTSGILFQLDCGDKIHTELLKSHLVGRFRAQDGLLLTEEEIQACSESTIAVRSPLTCQSSKLGFICQKCYGFDLSTNQLPELYLPVGILAAQSIGERGTQESMRTFHASERGKIADIPAIYEILSKGDSPLGKMTDRSEMLRLLLELVLNAQTSSSKLIGLNVNIKHFEVILRSLLRDDEGRLNWRGEPKFWRLELAAGAGPGLFDRMAFGHALENILTAVEQRKEYDLSGLRSRVIMGGSFPNTWS